MGARSVAAWFAVLTFVLGLSNYLTVTHAAPLEISNGNNRSVDEPVEELESLKQAGNKPLTIKPDGGNPLQAMQDGGKPLRTTQDGAGKPGEPVHISLSASRSSLFSETDGRRHGLSETQKQMNKNGELVARMSQKTALAQEPESEPQGRTQTELEVPSEGIHRSVQREEEPDAALEKMNAISGIEYSPLDMAEYVFWTGDEKGVALAIEDFLQEGLMSRDEAINFLQSIKSNLDYIQAHYQGLRKMEEKIAGKLQQQMANEENNSEFEKKIRTSLLNAVNAKSRLEKNNEEVLEEKRKRTETTDDYDEILDRLKGADQLYNDFSLEEVIYQLAKLMFSQSLTQGSSQAHQALRRFTDYLEKEVAYGQISKQLEKKILAVLVAALSDTLGERPELLAAASEGLSNIPADEVSSHVVQRRSQRMSPLSVQEPRSHILQRRSELSDIPVQSATKFGHLSAQEFRKHVAVRRSIAPASLSDISLVGSRRSSRISA